MGAGLTGCNLAIISRYGVNLACKVLAVGTEEAPKQYNGRAADPLTPPRNCKDRREVCHNMPGNAPNRRGK